MAVDGVIAAAVTAGSSILSVLVSLELGARHRSREALDVSVQVEITRRKGEVSQAVEDLTRAVNLCLIRVEEYYQFARGIVPDPPGPDPYHVYKERTAGGTAKLPGEFSKLLADLEAFESDLRDFTTLTTAAPPRNRRRQSPAEATALDNAVSRLRAAEREIISSARQALSAFTASIELSARGRSSRRRNTRLPRSMSAD